MRFGGGGGSGTPTGRSLSRLVLVQLAPMDDRDSVLVRPRAVFWRCSRSRQGGFVLEDPTVRVATGRSALGDLVLPLELSSVVLARWDTQRRCMILS